MIKTVIVDDESMSRKALERLCEKMEDLEVVAVLEDGLSAVQFLKNNTVDLVFLDLEMPELSGLEVIESLNTRPEIILTTGSPDYALQAFEHSVIDYLVKPVGYPRFSKAMDKYRALRSSDENTTAEADHLFVKADGKLVRLAYSDILYVESLRDYVIFKTAERRFIVHSTLKRVAEKLTDRAHFLKVHRSFIVNLTQVVDIEETNLVTADRMIPISRSNRAGLMERLNTM